MAPPLVAADDDISALGKEVHVLKRKLRGNDCISSVGGTSGTGEGRGSIRRRIDALDVGKIRHFLKTCKQSQSGVGMIRELVGILENEASKVGTKDFERAIIGKLHYPIYSAIIVNCFDFFLSGVAYKHFSKEGSEMKKESVRHRALQYFYEQLIAKFPAD